MLTLDNLPIFISVMVTLIICVSLIPVFRLVGGSAQRKKLMQNGEPAQALILKIWQTGLTVNNNPQVGFLLEVHLTNGTTFQAETQMLVSMLQIPQFQPGATVQVVFNPQDRRQIAIAGPVAVSQGYVQTRY